MAHAWLPVPDSLQHLLDSQKRFVDVSAARPTIDAILNNTLPSLPTKLSDFPAIRSHGQWLSRNVAAELGFIVGSASGSFASNWYLQQLRTWVDVPGADGQPMVRYGVAVRYIVELEEVKTGAKLNSIGGIAASASFEQVRASAEFKTLGIPADWVIGQTPTGGQFDLTKFVEFEGALKGAVRVLEEKKDQNLLPQILEVRADLSPDPAGTYTEPLAVCWALSCIKRRWELDKSKKEYGSAPDGFWSVVESIYATEGKVAGPNETPTKEAAQRAKSLLQGLVLEED